MCLSCELLSLSAGRVAAGAHGVDGNVVLLIAAMQLGLVHVTCHMWVLATWNCRKVEICKVMCTPCKQHVCRQYCLWSQWFEQLVSKEQGLWQGLAIKILYADTGYRSGIQVREAYMHRSRACNTHTA